MSCWNKGELEDVVNELDLSELAIKDHGQMGTPPAELVRLVLAEKTRKANEKLEADRQALEKEKADMAAKKYSGMWDEANRINWAIVNDSATLENEYFDRDKAQDEEDRKEKLQQNKERAALIGPDKLMITAIASDLDEMISECKIPVLNTSEANTLVVCLITALKTEIHAFETAGGGLV